MTKDTTQPMEEPISKNTIDDQILKGMGLEHIKDRIPSTVRIEWASSVHYIKQALHQDLMDMQEEVILMRHIGVEGTFETVKAIPVEKLNQYFGRG